MGDSFDFTRLGAPDWALDDLADYVVDRHHRYVQGAIPRCVRRWRSPWTGGARPMRPC